MTVRPEYTRRKDLSAAIRSERTPMAEAVTEEFLDRHPDWLDRYGELARIRGIEDARFHLDFLAGAIEGGTPEAFADYGRWTAGMLAARDIAPRFLGENFEQLRAPILRLVPHDSREFVSSILDAGIAAAGSEEGRASPSGSEERSGAGLEGLELGRSIYLQAILQGDKRAAMTVVEEVLGSHPVTAVYRGLVEAAQVEIGSLWARNEITVAREHMATAVSQYVLSRLYTHLPVPERSLGRAVLTGVEGEQHQLGANMVADLLEAEGWAVRFLGTQLPHRDIVAAVEEHGATVVGISATMLFNLPSTARLIRTLRDSGPKGLRIAVGGRAFQSTPDLWREIGADGAGRDLDEAIATFRSFAE